MEQNIDIKKRKIADSKSKTNYAILIVCLIMLSVYFLVIQNQLLSTLYADKSLGDETKVFY